MAATAYCFIGDPQRPISKYIHMQKWMLIIWWLVIVNGNRKLILETAQSLCSNDSNHYGDVSGNSEENFFLTSTTTIRKNYFDTLYNNNIAYCFTETHSDWLLSWYQHQLWHQWWWQKDAKQKQCIFSAVASMKLSMAHYKRDNLTSILWDKMQTQVLIIITTKKYHQSWR